MGRCRLNPLPLWERVLSRVSGEAGEGSAATNLLRPDPSPGLSLRSRPPSPTRGEGKKESLQQLQQIRFLLLYLIQRALLWRLVRTPAQQPRAVAEAFAGEMVVADFDNEL